jgi:hypothetical protein
MEGEAKTAMISISEYETRANFFEPEIPRFDNMGKPPYYSVEIERVTEQRAPQAPRRDCIVLSNEKEEFPVISSLLNLLR